MREAGTSSPRRSPPRRRTGREVGVHRVRRGGAAGFGERAGCSGANRDTTGGDLMVLDGRPPTRPPQADLELSWQEIEEAMPVLEASGSIARSGTPGAGPQPGASPVMQVNATVVTVGQAASPAASGSPVVPVRTVEQQQQRQAQHQQQMMKRRSSGGLRDTPPLPSLAEEQARPAGGAPKGRTIARTPATPGVAVHANGDANDRPALGLALDSEAVLREMQAASAGDASEPVASSPAVMPDCMRVCLPPPVSPGRRVEPGHSSSSMPTATDEPRVALATAAGYFGWQRVAQPGGRSIRCAGGRRALQWLGASPG